MVKLELDGETFVVEDGVFTAGPKAIAAIVTEGAKRARANSLQYIPDMDWYIGDYMVRELGATMVEHEPLEHVKGRIY